MPASPGLSTIISTLDGDPDWESTKLELITKLKKLFIKSVDALQIILDSATGDSNADPKVIRDVATAVIAALSASMNSPTNLPVPLTPDESLGLAYAVTKLAESVGTIDVEALKERILNVQEAPTP